MDLNEYQAIAHSTAQYPNVGDNLPYLGLGIAGEAGEVADKVKKFIRDSAFTGVADLSDEQKNDLALELGDVLWYIAQIATETGVDMDTVARMNTEKLSSRIERGKLGGSGDNR
ncbi:MAG: NTP pyrophosphatase (non-canonical NTP hydrolase) [Candidatus Azotimanducaceae bacterium]|jgi:NTP pyrophosphatase (non-canonical NTP hydrolase)